MKPTYVQAIIEENDNLKLEIAELRQALTGRTVSCHACNQSALERDMLRENIHEALEEIKELTRERDDVRAMMVTLCHKVVAAALSEEKDDGSN